MALAELRGTASGLCALAEIEDTQRLAGYPFYPAARGELELRSGHPELARACFTEVLKLARNEGERVFVARRLAACSGA